MTESCVTPGQLDTLLQRLGSIRDTWNTETGEIRAGLEQVEAGFGQSIRDNLDIIKETGDRNAEQLVECELTQKVIF